MNASELEVSSASLTHEGGLIAVERIEHDEELERLTLHLSSTVALGAAQIELDFTGILNDKLRGFYRSTYEDDAGQTRTLATTQFESTSARRAFPCWDEPDLKATFDVALTVDAAYTAISCQSEIGDEDLGDGRHRVSFATTPLMSTYLLAFIVGELEATEAVDAGGVPMRIIHVPGKGHMTQFALDAGKFAMDWLTEYFGIPYPGDKCDMVAIPDFAAGAMENLGCVTYREVLLLVDPDRTTQPEQQRAVDVIAHELAHMWFGDLVTMKWWNGLWLKEAFATFMEMLVCDAYRPEWNRWTDFGLSRSGAFRVDSLANTRPIEFEVHSPEDAEGMYDILTYEKGAAVVRMLEQFLGAEEFRSGVHHYLSRHAFANTETHDLWDALEETTGQPVRRIMDSWIFQGGFPLVDVSLADDATLRLTQQQFRFSGSTDATWSVPVVISCGRNGARSDSRFLLEGPEATVGPDSEPDWVLVNAGASGFYRVGYSPELLAGLLDHLSDLDPIERYGVVDDLWARMIAGAATLPEVMSALAMFSEETDVSVWQRVLAVVESVSRLSSSDRSADIAAFTRRLCAPALDRLGPVPVSGESDRTNELRAALLRVMGTTGADADTIARGRELFDEPDADPSLAAAALAIVCENGTSEDYAEVLRRYESAETPQTERRHLFALARFPAPEQMTQTLHMVSAGTVRTQEVGQLIALGMQNEHVGEQVWTFVAEHWDDLNARLPANSIPRLVSGITALTRDELARQITAFLDAHPVPQGELLVKQSVEQMHTNVELRARVGAQIDAALAAVRN